MSYPTFKRPVRYVALAILGLLMSVAVHAGADRSSAGYSDDGGAYPPLPAPPPPQSPD